MTLSLEFRPLAFFQTDTVESGANAVGMSIPPRSPKKFFLFGEGGGIMLLGV